MLAGTGEADWVDALHLTGAQVAGALEVSTPEAAAAVEYWCRHRTEIENIRAAEHGGALQHLPATTSPGTRIEAGAPLTPAAGKDMVFNPSGLTLS